MNIPTILRILAHLALGFAGSLGLLALLIHAGVTGQAGQVFPRLQEILTTISLATVATYVGASLFKGVLQARRYQLILRAGQSECPGLPHLFLVTMSRNMFIDMLPSRLGELSYVAMLRQGYAVPVAAGLSSLALAFLFDLLALAVLIVGVILWQILTTNMQWWLVGTALLIVLAFFVGLWLLFPGLAASVRTGRSWVASWRLRAMRRPAEKLLNFVDEFGETLRKARKAGIAGQLMLYSLGVRLAKYLGLYALFLGIVLPHFPGLNSGLASALTALLSAEAGASMPLPTFMGFGAYEAGGMLAMLALGATRENSLVIMLSLHLLSQVVDYALGGLAVLSFMALIFRKGQRKDGKAAQSVPWWRRLPWLALVSAAALCAVVAPFLLKEYRALRAKRAMVPPKAFGVAQPVDQEYPRRLAAMLGGRKGFVIWSSNRSGNHDLWILDLPNGKPERLTTHPHAESYPRISPDGNKVIFARAKEVWRTHLDFWGWDVYLLDLRTGEEKLVGKDGCAPSWSADGKKFYFQRDGRQIVERELISGKESVVLECGKNVPLGPDVWLGWPYVSPKGDRFAITLSGALRVNAIFDRQGGGSFEGTGCQLAWAPDGSYLFKVDHGGRQTNAFYKLDIKTLKPTKWLDMPGEFSHEYFPRVANSGDFLVFGASRGDHPHDKADYEIFLWKIGQPAESAVRLTYHSGNDNWPDVYLYP